MALIINGREYPCASPVVDWLTHGCHFNVQEHAVSRRPANVSVDMILVHSTAGEGNHKQVFNVLKGRVSPKAPKGLSVQFNIQQDGQISQYCDTNMKCVHGGSVYNPRSIGIEFTNMLVGKPHSKWPREKYVEKIRGHRVTLLRHYAAQIESGFHLINALTAAYKIKRAVPTFKNALVKDLLHHIDTVEWGIYGHYMLSKSKWDPGTDILGHLLSHGYR